MKILHSILIALSLTSCTSEMTFGEKDGKVDVCADYSFNESELNEISLGIIIWHDTIDDRMTISVGNVNDDVVNCDIFLEKKQNVDGYLGRVAYVNNVVRFIWVIDSLPLDQLKNIIAHELGHAFGCNHYDGNNLMNEHYCHDCPIPVECANNASSNIRNTY